MKVTFTRKNEHLVKCDVCDFIMVCDDEIDETKDHKHVSLRPVNISRLNVVWKGKNHLIFKTQKAYEKRLINDMNKIAHKYVRYFLEINFKAFVVYGLVRTSDRKLIGYITWNCLWGSSCHQIFVMPSEWRKRYGSFLQLKSHEIFTQQREFLVEDPNESSVSMLRDLMRSGYLQLRHEKLRRLKKVDESIIKATL